MLRFHSEEYVEFLQRVTPQNIQAVGYTKYLSHFSVGDDCPVFDGLFDFCALVSGDALTHKFRIDVDICVFLIKSLFSTPVHRWKVLKN